MRRLIEEAFKDVPHYGGRPFGMDDLPGADWWDAFSKGFTPKEAVNILYGPLDQPDMLLSNALGFHDMARHLGMDEGQLINALIAEPACNVCDKTKSEHNVCQNIRCEMSGQEVFCDHRCTYHYSGHLPQRLAILRKNGWAARSRNSHLKRVNKKLKFASGTKSVGQARKIIAQINKGSPEENKWGDPVGTRYMIRVAGHALLLGYDGRTIVDTAPRLRDRRAVLDIRAVF